MGIVGSGPKPLLRLSDRLRASTFDPYIVRSARRVAVGRDIDAKFQLYDVDCGYKIREKKIHYAKTSTKSFCNEAPRLGREMF
uniref:Uncharacterized protein n=1 Tax=Romanomermis culicivorax TaxID=13658 RepID=A0A915HJA1_ROMCU